MKQKSAVTVARKLAAQYWGRPDHQHKLADGIWRFSTPSHGGIIVDTQVRPEILTVCEHSFVYTRAGSDCGYSSEQHFVALEEDCDAAIAEWLFADLIITPRYQRYYRNQEDFDVWKNHIISILRKSLTIWHPEVLQKYPEPGTARKE